MYRFFYHLFFFWDIRHDFVYLETCCIAGWFWPLLLLPPTVMHWEQRCEPSGPASAFSLELVLCTSDLITHKFTFSSSVKYKSHSVVKGDKEGCVKYLKHPNFFSLTFHQLEERRIKWSIHASRKNFGFSWSTWKNWHLILLNTFCWFSEPPGASLMFPSNLLPHVLLWIKNAKCPIWF